MSLFGRLSLGITDEDLEKVGKVDIGDWQTYRNDEYGFEVRYHPYWEPATTGFFDSSGDTLSSAMFNNYQSEQKEVLPFMSIIVHRATAELLGQLNSANNIEVNGLTWKIQTSSNYLGHEFLGFQELDNGNILTIRVIQIEDQGKAETIFNQILSTFKFLE